MQVVIVGLGRMGANIARRLHNGGHQVFAYNRTAQKTKEIEREGIIGIYSLEEILKLSQPRIVWMMLPAGDPTEEMLKNLIDILSPGDIIVDGGNSNYKDTVRRADFVKGKGLHLVDVGTSGGIWGLKEGYSLMIGGEKKIVDSLTPLFKTLAPEPNKGWGYVGPSGAGHFVKMVHNGIEYGMMEALAEGFEILKNKKDFNLDLAKISQIWRYGSVIRSWLLDLTADALSEDQELEGIEDYVVDSGEGRWTVIESIDLSIPAPVIAISLMRRFASRQDESFACKLLAAMRNKFGGHEVKIKREE
ncbi:MAG: phosphogluconate dehydrogenase (NAD(+)-dependent, decarboxylating) [bacterium]